MILGGLASFALHKEARPNVNFNVISISVSYPNSTPQDVEQLVVQPIEEKLDNISGIKKYQSSSFAGLGNIAVKVDPNYKDKDKVVDEIRRLIEQIDVFPDNVSTPIIREVKAEHIPILTLAVSGNIPYLDLRKEVDLLKDKISALPAISEIMLEGYYDLQFHINADLDALDKNLISVEQIINIIRSYNISSPAGQIIKNGKEYDLKISESLTNLELIEDIPLRVNDQNYLVKMSDIAEVTQGFADKNIRKFYNSVPAITLIITKKQGFDTIKTIKQINEIVKDYQNNDLVNINEFLQ